MRLNFKKKRLSEIAKDLNRSIASASNKAQILGLKIKRRWTQEEIDYVRDNLNLIPVQQIAKELFRTTESVREMMSNNGLRVTDEIDITLKDVCRQIDLDYFAVHYGIQTGEMKTLGRLVGASRSYIFDLEDLRSFVFKKFTYKDLRCYDCGEFVNGDIYCEKHLPFGSKKKPKPKTEFMVPIKNKNYRPKLRDALAEIREQNCLTQEELSEKCGYGKSWYGVFERLEKPMITLDQMIEVMSKMDYEFEIIFKKKVEKQQ
jgi:hypothetical protein